MSKILVVVDYPAGAVSGYATIAKPICNGLCDFGHEVKLLAFSNKGEEHTESFSIIPVENYIEAQAAIHNLGILWKPDVIICAMDIPSLGKIFSGITRPEAKYLAITAMENGPLIVSWAMILSTFDKVLFISELGKVEAQKTGLQNVDHLVVGIDRTVWYPASYEEKLLIRKQMGFSKEDKIILTVADNQERKNLWGGMAIVSELKKCHPELSIKYIIVTRVDSQVGWRLQELAKSLDLQNEYVEFDRGMSVEELRLLYACSDVFLLPSKAEGLGLPILEALSMRLECVGTDTGAIHELLTDSRGHLVPSDYSFIDTWGNSKRDMISITKGADILYKVLMSDTQHDNESYLNNRNIENSVIWFNNLIGELTNE